jgi:hypothetical protein
MLRHVALAALFTAAHVHAATSSGPVTDLKWQPMRGTTNIGTPVATEAACWAVLEENTEARKASANVECRHRLTRRITYTAPPPPPPPAGPVSLWPATAVPAAPDNNDGQPLNLGVRFSSSANGYVTAVRFYKGTGNTGTHVASLWDSAGAQLAQSTFTGETASGWQQVPIGPVAIVPGATYTASYHSPGGYAITANFSWPLVSGPLTAYAGTFAYAASSTWPTQEWSSSNYWVDVVFSPASTPQPSGTATLAWDPATGATGYRIYYGTSPRTYQQSKGSGLPVSGTSAYLTGFLSGLTYYFAVTSTDATGESDYSNEDAKVMP